MKEYHTIYNSNEEITICADASENTELVKKIKDTINEIAPDCGVTISISKGRIDEKKKMIELVKSYSLARYDAYERQDICNEFHKILIKHDFDKHTSVPTHTLMDFLWKWFNELPIFPNEFDKLNENYPPQMEGVKKEYV